MLVKPISFARLTISDIACRYCSITLAKIRRFHSHKTPPFLHSQPVPNTHQLPHKSRSHHHDLHQNFTNKPALTIQKMPRKGRTKAQAAQANDVNSTSGKPTTLSTLLEQKPDILYRLKALLYDLTNLPKDPRSQDRLASTTHPLYISPPYFSEEQASQILESLVPPPKPLDPDVATFDDADITPPTLTPPPTPRPPLNLPTSTTHCPNLQLSIAGAFPSSAITGLMAPSFSQPAGHSQIAGPSPLSSVSSTTNTDSDTPIDTEAAATTSTVAQDKEESGEVMSVEQAI